MCRKSLIVALLAVLSLSPLLRAVPTGGNPDEVIVRYPQGFTHLVVADLAKILNDPVLTEAVLAPLRVARHPLNGIAQTIQDTLGLSPDLVSFVAHGTGPNLSGVSLIQGPPQQATLGPLSGLQFAVGAPQSPFTNWELSTSNGLPLVRTGGVFGPVHIQWGYAFEDDALWIGTEVAFGQDPNVNRLANTLEALTARVKGRGAYFDELPIALAVRGGDVAFVRRTNLALDRPVSSGEQALGFALNFTESGALVQFDLRFESKSLAAAALAALQDGSSPYLAQDLYRGQLESARRQGRELSFAVTTNLSGVVGLLLVVMPN